MLENVIVGAQRFRRAGFFGALLALPRSDRDERALRERRARRRPGRGDVEELGTRIGGLRGSTAVMLVEHRIDLVMSVCDPTRAEKPMNSANLRYRNGSC